ncbi:ATP-binding protein [Paraburkholderia sp.]|uniref:sensor histidine kinase n=1 Tax=Paraburkholderia sp. TaxID=1926495 RepID=UPI0025EC7D12|nr:ATP-binding protein [Paraburkholderia sp.]
MAFKITARTILHLGADLISSDAVALYELIKNAIDAKSKNGVDISFEILIKESDFSAFIAKAEDAADEDIPQLKLELFDQLLPDAPDELISQFSEIVSKARTTEEFISAARVGYRDCNRIIVSDTGHGMTLDELSDIYLTIGTTHRTNEVKKALASSMEKTPYLGEKGVGRLSVMRLGRCVRIETCSERDDRWNILDIDWDRFADAYDKPASSVELVPTKGQKKTISSGTRIIITNLSSSWTQQRLAGIAQEQISKIADPFSIAEKRKFSIRLKFNGMPIDQSRNIADLFLKSAHAVCTGDYTLQNGIPQLRITMNSDLYEGPPTEYIFDLNDLKGMAGLRDLGQPSSVLRSLGPFKFQLYWFNRQRLKAVPDLGEREAVRKLVKAWAGICLFRDGYRVLPYGDEGDDWLGLDREALAAGGYKLNTKQLIGRVQIGRITNPALLDQTNRQGLTDCPEKSALIKLLWDVISEKWHTYLNDSGAAQKMKDALGFDPQKESAVVSSLESRTKVALKAIRKNFSGDTALLQQVTEALTEIKDAHEKAVARIGAIEEEKERLTQLAGIGLMIEVIAHELARSTELTQKTLKSVKRRKVDSETASAFQVLSTQIKIIQKRLQTLEPLSITARQRRSEHRLSAIVSYVLEAHNAQFERHAIDGSIMHDSDLSAEAFVIEGNVVQIIENLIHNSVYWLEMKKDEHVSFEKRIEIKILSSPPRIQYFDNGPGIPVQRAQSVFEPFFSTKSGTPSRRKGLGLYIARQNAELLGGTLELIEEGNVHPNRFNTFELSLVEKPE